MKLSNIILTVAMFACALAKVMRCPETNCRLKLCNNFFHDVVVRDDFNGNMLRADGIDMGGTFCYPRARSTPRQLVNVELGEAMVSVQESENPLVKISDFPGVHPAFPRNYFQVIKTDSGLEKITRKKASGNQFEKTDNLCIVLPIKSYRMKRPDGAISGKRYGDVNDCVALRVQAKRLQFEMVWNNTDDIDFTVREPSGFFITRSRKESPSGGRLNTDVAPGCTDRVIPGEQYRETVSWEIDQAPPSGMYTANASLFGVGCGNGPVKVCLRVSVDGMLMEKRCKVIDGGSSRKSFSVHFRI